MSLYAIHTTDELLPIIVGPRNTFRFVEGSEQCEDCGADMAESLRIVGKVMNAKLMRCACGADYTARPFVYPETD